MSTTETTTLPLLITDQLLSLRSLDGPGDFLGENGEVFDYWSPTTLWKVLATRVNSSNTIESIAKAKASIELHGCMGYDSLAVNWSTPDQETADKLTETSNDNQCSTLYSNEPEMMQAFTERMKSLKAKHLQARAKKISTLIRTAQPFWYVCRPTMKLSPVYIGQLDDVVFMQDHNDSTLRPVLQDTNGSRGILPVEFDSFITPLCTLRSDT